MTDILDDPAVMTPSQRAAAKSPPSSPEACFAYANAVKIRLVRTHFAPSKKLQNLAGIGKPKNHQLLASAKPNPPRLSV